jgi:pimeloyl-ACP methyl ester carboxylesterase
MPNRKHQPRPAAPIVHEVVDPRWIISALGIMLAVCVVCAYIAVCVLFYRGQWQLALQPSRTVTQTPATLHLPFTELRFGTDATGQPQLNGWWIPASQPSAPTALVLHSGNGSMSDALPTARILHEANLNVLLFDYRGFGRSGGQHPTQALMQADATSALHYLTDTRSIPASSILVFGTGVGASLAVQLCASHPELNALILQDADGDLDQRVAQDSRSRMVPIGLLFNQHFPLAAPLRSLTTPKLLITLTKGPAPQIFQQAADPKTTLELPPNSDSQLQTAIQTFYDATVKKTP